MKELLITLITLAGLFIGVYYMIPWWAADRRISNRRRKLPSLDNNHRQS